MDCPPLDVTATISMPMNANVASSLVLNETSFQSVDEQLQPSKTTGGLIEFQIHGKFIHFNTIEEYQAFDFTSLQADLSL